MVRTSLENSILIWYTSPSIEFSVFGPDFDHSI